MPNPWRGFASDRRGKRWCADHQRLPTSNKCQRGHTRSPGRRGQCPRAGTHRPNRQKACNGSAGRHGPDDIRCGAHPRLPRKAPCPSPWRQIRPRMRPGFGRGYGKPWTIPARLFRRLAWRRISRGGAEQILRPWRVKLEWSLCAQRAEMRISTISRRTAQAPRRPSIGGSEIGSGPCRGCPRAVGPAALTGILCRSSVCCMVRGIGPTSCLPDHPSVFRAPLVRDAHYRARTKSAIRSPIMIAAALVLPDTTVGMIEASATRRPMSPCTESLSSTTAIGSVPMRQVLVG